MPELIICMENWKIHFTYSNQINAYELYYTNTSNNKADGVAVFENKKLKKNTVEIKIGRINAMQTSIEINKNKHILLLYVYRTLKVIKAYFIRHFNQYLKSIPNNNVHYVNRDLNIDIIEPDTLSEK